MLSKHILTFICCIFVTLIGCKPKVDMRAIEEKRVGQANLEQQAGMHNDNVLWQKALELSDSLMSTDTLQPYRANYYYNRTLILSRLRHWKKYLHTQELYFMCLPEKNPDRLLFLGSKYMMENKKDSANYYLDEVSSVCD